MLLSAFELLLIVVNLKTWVSYGGQQKTFKTTGPKMDTTYPLQNSSLFFLYKHSCPCRECMA